MTTTAHPGDDRAPAAEPLPERPNGTYVTVTGTLPGWPDVSIMVREDDRQFPDEPHRWRAVDRSGAWMTWEQVLRSGHVEPLYSHDELLHAASAAPDQQHPQVAPAHRAARPHPTNGTGPPGPSMPLPPQRSLVNSPPRPLRG
jgi:hypothetical protein